VGAEESRGCEVGQEDFPVQQLGFMEQALKSEERVDASAALMPTNGLGRHSVRDDPPFLTEEPVAGCGAAPGDLRSCFNSPMHW